MKRTWLIVFGDFVSFLASFLILIIIRFKAEHYQSAIESHTLPFLILYLSWVFIFYVFGLYDLVTIKPTIPYLKRWILAFFISFVFGIFLFYFIPIFGITPKTNLFLQVIGFGTLSFLVRRIMYKIFSGKIKRPIVIAGQTKYSENFCEMINKNPQLGLEILDRQKNVQDLLDRYIHKKNVIFVFEENYNDLKISDIYKIYINNAEIYDIAEMYEKYLYKIPVEYVSETWIARNIKINKNKILEIGLRLFEISIALIILIASSPLLIISAISIYLNDKGPIIYKQDRVGLDNKIFKLYKLRSMVVNAEKEKAIWGVSNDPRVTKIGKIIRKLHIDEIPQMINILKGDMALVGPRPERPEFIKNYFQDSVPYYSLRQIIKPGFTGWAQIKYRYAYNTDDVKERFEYDLYYIKNKNIFIDIGIIIRTVQIIFTH